jgi:hypothetical protein
MREKQIRNHDNLNLYVMEVTHVMSLRFGKSDRRGDFRAQTNGERYGVTRQTSLLEGGLRAAEVQCLIHPLTPEPGRLRETHRTNKGKVVFHIRRAGIQPLASKFISGPPMSKYSTSCAAALTTKIRFPETSEVSRRSGSVRG